MRLVVPPQEQQEYVDAPVERRREILAHIDESLDPRTAPQALWNTPIRIDQIEWFATPGDLCRIMNTLRTQMLDDQPLIQAFLSQNVGTDVPVSSFRYIGYKGGSEMGVVSRTWLIQRASDLAWRCVTFTWNDTLRDVDMNRAAYIGEAIAASAGKW